MKNNVGCPHGRDKGQRGSRSTTQVPAYYDERVGLLLSRRWLRGLREDDGSRGDGLDDGDDGLFKSGDLREGVASGEEEDLGACAFVIMGEFFELFCGDGAAALVGEAACERTSFGVVFVALVDAYGEVRRGGEGPTQGQRLLLWDGGRGVEEFGLEDFEA